MTVETIYLGKDNAIDKELREDGSAVNLSSVTRMTVDFDGTLIDSDVVGEGSGQPFDWTQGSGKVVFSFGSLTIPAGNYEAELTVYDASNPNGLVWGTFLVTVE